MLAKDRGGLKTACDVEVNKSMLLVVGGELGRG
jgi:hypothetical protein